MSQSRRRVVVTGMGAVSALGLDLPTQWEALLAGRSGIGPIDSFPAERFPCHSAGIVRGLDPRRLVADRKALRAMDKHSHMAFAAAGQALHDARLDIRSLEPPSTAILLGTGMIDYSIADLERAARRSLGPSGGFDVVAFGRDGIQEIYPLFPVELLNNATLCQIAMQYGIRGPNATFSPFGESGAQAIGEAFRLLRRGGAEVALAGGYSLQVNPSALARFSMMGILDTSSDENLAPCRPWDRTRAGLVLGEGAGMLVLETLEHALDRQAPIHAEILGYGSTSGPSRGQYPTSEVIAVGLRRALADASVGASALDYVHADAPGLPDGDAAEANALAEVLGVSTDHVLVNSTKGATGHLLAGAAPFAMVTTILALEAQVVPPTTHLTQPDPACRLSLVTGCAHTAVLRTAACLAAGFWGQSASLIAATYRD